MRCLSGQSLFPRTPQVQHGDFHADHTGSKNKAARLPDTEVQIVMLTVAGISLYRQHTPGHLIQNMLIGAAQQLVHTRRIARSHPPDAR